MSINQKDIIYFVLTDRFYSAGKPVSKKGLDKNIPNAYHGGNFDGLIEKIPYLKNLGITAVWITPVYWQVDLPADWGQAYHGYWALDFNKVDPHLYTHERYEPGSRKYLKDLCDIFHKNNIKLILDVVVNHAGYNHPGQIGAADNPTPIQPEWFNTKGLSSDQNLIEGELCGLPDFNLDNLDVIDYHVQSLIGWVKETGIDGIRMDTAKHVERGFWNYFKTQIRGKYPEVSLIGEVLEFNIDDLTNYQKFWGFDSLFDFPVQKTIMDVFVYGQSLTMFYSPYNMGFGIFEHDNAYSNQNRLVSLLDNHDLSCRFMTAALKACSNDYRKATDILKLALTFIFTTRGIPQVYYGTEVALEGGSDPDNRRDFPWNKIGSDNEVLPQYKIEKEVFDYTKKLIKLRKKHDALHAGTFVSLYVDHFIFAFLNCFDNDVVITIINNGENEMSEPLKISINNNSNIPSRIKKMIQNKKMTCQLSGIKSLFIDGTLEVKMSGKSAMVMV
jgi:alpha-amylase